MPDRSDFELVAITLQFTRVPLAKLSRPEKNAPHGRALAACRALSLDDHHGEAFQRIADEDCELHGFNRYDF